MADREQVLKALRACSPGDTIWCQMRVKGQCDYAGEHCMARLLSDAAELLTPRVLTLEKVEEGKPYWLEMRGIASEYAICKLNDHGDSTFLDFAVRYGDKTLESDGYGKTWRCWTSRPTDKQREATPWA